MANQETMATSGTNQTKDEDKQNTKTQHRDEKHRPHQKPGVNIYM